MMQSVLKHLTVAVIAALTLATDAVALEKEHSFNMATAWSNGPLMEIGAKAFAEKVNEMSNGRIEIKVYPAGTLGPGLKVSETVKNGDADMGHTWMGYDWGQDPTTVLFGGFAGSFDSERMLHWLYRGGGADLQAEFRVENFGLISMPLFIRTAEAFLHSHKPVSSLADLQGLKLRTAGAWVEISRDMGAEPVTLQGRDVYPALASGSIDATEWGTLWENETLGFHRITKYVIIPGVHQPTAPFELVINIDSWNQMSGADQILVRDAAFMTTLNSWLTVGQNDAEALAFFREQGNEIIELDAEVQYHAREAGLEWAEGVAEENEWFKRVLDNQKTFIELWKGSSRYRKVKVRETTKD